MIPSYRRPLLLAALSLALVPAGAQAQFRRGRGTQDVDPGTWAPITVGVYGGYDNSSFGAEVVAGRAFLPVVRSGRVQIVPSAEITFVAGAHDKQYSADVVYMTGGRSGGLYVGGGVGRRDSVVDGTPAEPRSTFLTWEALAGLQGQVTDRVYVQLQFRRLWLQDVVAEYRPTSFTLGATFALWR